MKRASRGKGIMTGMAGRKAGANPAGNALNVVACLRLGVAGPRRSG